MAINIDNIDHLPSDTMYKQAVPLESPASGIVNVPSGGSENSEGVIGSFLSQNFQTSVSDLSAENFLNYGIASAIGASTTAAVSTITRSKLNTVLRGGTMMDDHLVTAKRTARNALFSFNPFVAGAIGMSIGNFIANRFDPDNKNNKLQYGLSGIGAVSGFMAGLALKPIIGAVNGAYIANDIRNNIGESRMKIARIAKSPLTKILAMPAGALIGVGANFVPFGTIAMNTIGFGASDALADFNTARNNAITGIERKSKKDFGSFMSDFDGAPNCWSASERSNVVQNISNLLESFHNNSITEDKKENLFTLLKSILPIRYETYKTIPSDFSIFLADMAHGVYMLKISNNPNVKAISIDEQMQQLYLLHKKITANSTIDITLYKTTVNGGTTTIGAEDWKSSSSNAALTIKRKILENNTISEFIWGEISNDEKKLIWRKINAPQKYNDNIDTILNIMNDSFYDDIKKNLQKEENEENEEFLKKNIHKLILYASSALKSTYKGTFSILHTDYALQNKLLKTNQVMQFYNEMESAEKNNFWNNLDIPKIKDIKNWYTGNAEELFKKLRGINPNNDQEFFWDTISPKDDQQWFDKKTEFDWSKHFPYIDYRKQTTLLSKIEENVTTKNIVDDAIQEVVKPSILIENTMTIPNNTMEHSDAIKKIFSNSPENNQNSNTPSLTSLAGMGLMIKETWDQVKGVLDIVRPRRPRP